MERSGYFSVRVVGGLLLLFAWGSGVDATEQDKLELKEKIFFGGSGDQGASQIRELGMAVQGGHLYLVGVDKALYGGQALAASYALPLGSSPLWAFRWPNKQGSGWWNDEVFTDVVATGEHLYVSGWSMTQTSDGVGDREYKSILAKFPLSGPTGPDIGGALWVAKPNFFTYRGIEGYFAVTAVEEGGSPFIYAAGHAQANGVNNTAILAKYDTNGKLLWSKILGNTGWFMNSYAWAVTELNGHIYVAGETNYPYYLNNPVATLWKYDSAGNQIWMKKYWQLATTVYRAVDMVVLNGSLYLATARRNVPSWGADAMVFQCDEAGNLGRAWAWGREKDDAALGIAADAERNRLYVVGETSGSRSAGGKDVLLLELKIDPDYWWMVSEIVYGGAQDDFARRVRVVGENVYVAGESKSFATAGNAVGQSDVMLLRYQIKPHELVVPIDIKPEGEPNSINPKSHGKIPVAILSTAEFDAPAMVNRGSLTFGRTGAEVSLAFCSSQEDVNADGLLDVVCHFNTDQTAFETTDSDGVLKGSTRSGMPIRGTDSIRIVPSPATR